LTESIINPGAILLATIIGIGIHLLWYSPALFGNRWQKLAHVSDAEHAMNAAKVLTLGATTLATTIVLAYLITFTGAQTILEGGLVGCFLWFGFVMTLAAQEIAFARVSFAYYAITASYHLVNLVVAGMILSVFR